MFDSTQFDAFAKFYDDFAEAIERAPLFEPWEEPPPRLAKIHVTFFKDFAAKTYTTDDLTLTELQERIQNASARRKDDLPWLKLAEFGKKRTAEGSLRHNANVVQITGVELDYDDERIAFDDVVNAIQEMGITALAYTSPTHSVAAPRWRILAPTSQRLQPDMRAKLVARLNGCLRAKFGGEKIAASESFALSQSYFYGWVMNKQGLDHRSEVIIGDFIDLRDDLAGFEPWGAKKADETCAGESDPFADYSDRYGPKRGKSDDELTALLKQSRATPGKGWRDPMLRFIGSTVGKGWSDLQIKLACSPYSDGGIDDHDIRGLIDCTRKKFGKLDTEDATTEQPQAPESKARASSALALAYYDELSDSPPKFWIMKFVLARGETSNWFGPPGVGKSVLMTDLAFHVAWGCDWRGYRSKECCGVVYIALERGGLVKRRLSAYRRKYGAPDLPIAVASNVIDLKNKGCVKLIVDTIREAEARFGCKVGLIVIDTISKGIAAGGGDEDKAKDVNVVLANLRRVEELTNVHIACVGHTGKDEERGHRGSNANLGDVDLMVQISGGEGAVKTATVIKVNDGMEGPLTHYKIESALLGTDEDGDAVTTAIISDDAAEAAQEAKVKKGLSGTQRRAMELLTRCINDNGRPPPASQEFPRNVRVVALEEWHTACERGSLSSAKEKEDRDRAFRRAKDDLQTFNRIACLDGLVWLVRDDG